MTTEETRGTMGIEANAIKVLARRHPGMERAHRGMGCIQCCNLHPGVHPSTKIQVIKGTLVACLSMGRKRKDLGTLGTQTFTSGAGDFLRCLQGWTSKYSEILQGKVHLSSLKTNERLRQ